MLTVTSLMMNNEHDVVRVPSKSDVTVMLDTDISTQKGMFAERVQALLGTISSAIEIWDDLYDVEKISLHENVAYIIKVIGVAPSAAVVNQLTIARERPFMQYQGSSSYCGVSAVNNALQCRATTVEKFNDIADNLWLVQIEQVELTIYDDLQKMRDIDGNYSVDVLKQASEDLGYEMVNLDNIAVTKLSQPLDANTTLNQLRGLITHRGPKAIIVADSRGEGIPHYSTILFSNTAVWHLNSLRRRPKVVSNTWMMALLKDTQVAHSKVCLYTLQPLKPTPHSETPTPSFEVPESVVVIEGCPSVWTTILVEMVLIFHHKQSQAPKDIGNGHLVMCLLYMCVGRAGHYNDSQFVLMGITWA